MCGGVLGEMFKGVDDVANQINPLHHFMGKAADVAGDVWKPLGKAGHWGNDHPAEAAALAAAGYGAYAYLGAGGLGGMGGEAAGEAAGDAAGGGTSMGGAAGTLGAADSSAASAELGLSAADVGGTSGAAATGAANTGNALSNLFATGSGAAGAPSGGMLGGWGSGIGLNAATAKNGLGAMQVLSSLYGMEQSRKLSKDASAQSMSNAGLQAVQRSMAAQGYQGSGNMMQALSKYGADAYGSNLAQRQASLNNTMGGLGLLTAGLGNMAGWGGTKP